MNLLNSAVRFLVSTAPLRHQSPEERAIQRFKDLEPGWGVMGEGRAFAYTVIERAIFMVATAKSVDLEVEVHPGYDGEILVTVFAGAKAAEFYVMEDSLEYVLELDSIELEHRQISGLREAARLIISLGGETWWGISEFSTQGITTQGSETSSSAWRFVRAALTLGKVSWESQFSVKSALPKFPAASASI